MIANLAGGPFGSRSFVTSMFCLLLTASACAPAEGTAVKTADPSVTASGVRVVTADAATAESRPQRLDQKTRSLVAAAAKGDFVLASHDFDATMQTALPPATLEATWKSVSRRSDRSRRSITSNSTTKKASP